MHTEYIFYDIRNDLSLIVTYINKVMFLVQIQIKGRIQEFLSLF